VFQGATLCDVEKGSNGREVVGGVVGGLTRFHISRIIETVKDNGATDRAARFADMFAAMGAEPRLRIMQLLLTAHPRGLVVGDVQDELGIPASTLSHHLDKLKNEGLVHVRREGSFLWYTASIEALQELLGFLYAECCTRNGVIKPGEPVTIGQSSSLDRERRRK
jgi:ArsR family transcriptional regulator, arsenate/arsenite/antimonite-responsive transcriptional repressor